MANSINYVTKFERQIIQKYAVEAVSGGISSVKVSFLDAKTVKLPYLTVGGYKDHVRTGGFNRQDVTKLDLTKTLTFDRDVEFFVDAMDVDESNQVATAANVTNEFLTSQAIPEEDAYRFSKLLSEFTTAGGTVDTTALNESNILDYIDDVQGDMNDAGVPQEGRILYATNTIVKAIKKATEGARTLTWDSAGGKTLNGQILRLDNLLIKEVPIARFKSAYDFTDGWAPAAGAKQINAIIVHPSAVIAPVKHSYIRLWPEGTHTQGDGWLYQNRKYSDLFIVDYKRAGVAINREA